jgi:glycerol-3-phosphate O-acyltransferase
MKYIEPFPAVFKKMSDWPIYKLSQDRRRFIAEIDDFTIDRLIKEHPKLYDLIVQTLYQERIRIKETPWKVDPPNERQFLDRIRKQLVQSETEPKPKAAETHRNILRKFVHRYSEEIVGTFSLRAMRFARSFLSLFFNRLLNAATERWWRFLSSKSRLHERIQVYGDVQTIQDLFSKGTVVVVPTHFSNLDSVLIGFAMDHIMGLPQFSYGAGLNLYNSGAAAFFMNRLGAYRVDRRKKNPIYLETLKGMCNLAIQRGTNTLFFPGGTRSRSGEVEKKLKMGLLGTTVEAQRALCERGDTNKVFIVPLTTSYHTVLEAPFLIHQHLQIVGKERYLVGRSEGNSFREWFKFIWQFFAERSDIVLSFGKPIDVLGNFVDAEGISRDSRNNVLNIADYFITEGVIKEDLQREGEYTKLLADKIVDRFHRENIVLSSHVVAFTAFNILKESNEKLDLYALLRLPPDDYVFPLDSFTAAVAAIQAILFDHEEKGRLKLSDSIRLSPEELVQDGVKNLGVYHVRKPLLFNKKGDLESDDFNVLFFYHNRLENFSLAKRVKWEKFKLVVKDFVEPVLEH